MFVAVDVRLLTISEILTLAASPSDKPTFIRKLYGQNTYNIHILKGGNVMKNKDFWIAAVHRALWTMGQTALGSIGAARLMEEVDWKFVLSASILAGIVSLIKSYVVGLPEAGE